MFCSQCGAYLPNGSKFCGQCGKSVLTTKKKCPKCKNEYEITMVFCNNCGTLLETYNIADNVQSSILTANYISLFEERHSTVLPKKIGELSFFNNKITFTPVKGKTPINSELIEFWYDDIYACETTRHYGIPGIAIKMKNGNKYSFIGSFSQPGYSIETIKKMIMHHI